MHVTLLRIFRGPSALADEPVLVWRLDLPGEDTRSFAKRGYAAFQASFPLTGIRIADGSPALAVAGLVAVWARELLNAANGLIDSAGARVEVSGDIIGWCGYRDAELAAAAVRIASALVAKAGGRTADDGPLDRMRRVFTARAATHHPKLSALPMAKAAKARGIPFTQSPVHPALWCYGWGRAGRTMSETSSFEDSYLGHWVAGNKGNSRKFLLRLGFPVTEHEAVATADEAVEAAARIGAPIVIKPANRGKGRGVTTGITADADIRAAYAQARAWSEHVIVERFVSGQDHRLLVIGGQLVAAARRDPPSVIGDGRQSVSQLIAALGLRRPLRPDVARYMPPVLIDDIALDHLRRQGASLDTVPSLGATVTLRGNANISSGGVSTDVLGLVHPDIRAMAEMIARNVGIHALGIDYITTDIAKPWRETNGAIIEINSTPGIKMHVASGVPEEEIGAVVLGPDVGRIPVAVVIASVADQRALLREIEGVAGAWAPAWQCGTMGDGQLRIGPLDLTPAGANDYEQVQQLLQHRDCDAAIICVTSETLLETGFPVDRCQLSLVIGETVRSTSLRQLLERCSETVVESGVPGAEAALPLLAIVGPRPTKHRPGGK